MDSNKLSSLLVFLLLAFGSFGQEVEQDMGAREARLKNFVGNYLQKYDSVAFDDGTSNYAFSLNKSTFKHVQKFGFSLRKGAKNRGNFYLKYYTYEDSASCMAAYERWLHNFGSMGVPVKRGQKIDEFPFIPVLGILYEKAILVLFMDCALSKSRRKSIQKDLERLFLDGSQLEYLQSACGGPLRWN